jgi:hypothetical protein
VNYLLIETDAELVIGSITYLLTAATKQQRRRQGEMLLREESGRWG